MSILERKYLGASCPFGYESSSKHLSLQENCPDLRLCTEADREISQTLREFNAFIRISPRTWAPRPLDELDEIAHVASAIHENAPTSFSEIFPLDPGRNAQALLDRVANGNTIMGRAILAAHRHAKLSIGSDCLSARAVMAAIGHGWKTITSEPQVGELQLATFLEGLARNGHTDYRWRAPDAFGSEHGIAVSAASLRDLITYQKIQERPDSEAAVKNINNGLADRTATLEELLGIISAIASDLQLWFDEIPERIAHARAFSEIALIDKSGRVVLNSRFFKILMHNWGGFIADRPHQSIHEVVENCVTRARLNLIYEQNILVIRRDGTSRRLFGVAVRACPAAAIIGPLVSHYAATARR